MTKIAISIDENTVRQVDELVLSRGYPSRSKLFQEAVEDKLKRVSRSRLAEQCALMNPEDERELAEEFSPDEIALWQQS